MKTRSLRLFVLPLSLILAFACKPDKTNSLIQSCYGQYTGYCIVGIMQGTSTIQFNEDGVSLKYTVVVPRNPEEVVLRTGSEKSVIEAGKLEDLKVIRDSNGIAQISARWMNDDKIAGNGTFRLFLSSKEKNKLVCTVIGASNWECTGYVKYTDESFRKILSVLCSDTTKYKNLFIITKNKAETINIEAIKRQLEINDSLLELRRKCPDFYSIQDPTALNSQIEKYTNDFYNSLEQSKEENSEAYASGSPFKRNDWKTFLYDGISFSRKRLENLIGQYHTNYTIKLKNISDINRSPDRISVKTIAEYIIDEVGVFENEEELIFKKGGSGTAFAGWYDIKPLLKEKFEYDGLENIDATELYKILGRNSADTN